MITEKYLTPNPKTRPQYIRLSDEPIKGLVFHWAANPGCSLQNMWDFLEYNVPNNPEQYSRMYHFLVREEIWQIMPLVECGGSVGLERLSDYDPIIRNKFLGWPDRQLYSIILLEKDSRGHYDHSTLQNGMILGSYLCRQEKLNPFLDLYTHYDITGKPCPRLFVDHPSRWAAFIESIKTLINAWDILEESNGS